MNVLADIEDLRELPGPLHLAIGVFDGVHLGHRAVIEEALNSARDGGGSAVVVTFDPHPVEVLIPERAPRLLTATEHKLIILARETGIAHTLVVRFDSAFAAQTGETFVHRLLAAAPPEGIARICVGRAWQFGKGRSGDFALLERLGSQHGFAVSGIETVEVDGERVSSTRVREAVAAGDFATASRLLGRTHTVFGSVEKGRQLGRTIGFPTANLAVACEQLPPGGVYAVRVTGAGDGWNGVANLGTRPTVEGDGGQRKLEVHLFGFDAEIYGESLEVEFVAFVRPERKFEGVEELQAQIARDAEEARRLVGI